MVTQESGWISSKGADDPDLTDEQRQILQERRDRQGQLLGVVQVRVFENQCVPYVTFPQDSTLSAETDQSEVAEMVARARRELEDWQ
jgi:hypothetical protein